jgi:hypothetical protein
VELGQYTIPGKTVLQGSGAITVNAGQSLKIETSPGGSEILNEECPAGKVWRGTIKVELTEEDA